MLALDVLSAGAAQALARRLAAQQGLALQGSFGAVGAMQEQLLRGAACDLLILTRAMIDALTAQGHVLSGTAADLGAVATGLAVKADAPDPAVSDEAGLIRVLQAARALYMPDPVAATAGRHVMAVLEKLGLAAALAPRLKQFPNGAAAMRALSEAAEPMALGITQETEIRATPGLVYAGPLPRGCDLATVYTAAIPVKATRAEAARRFIQVLGGPESLTLRREAGFG